MLASKLVLGLRRGATLRARTRLRSGLFLLLAFLGCKPQPSETIPLWSKGAPGSEARRHEPEAGEDWWVGNVHDPSLVVFQPPRDKRTSTGVIVVPGGGHEKLVYHPEGVDPARFLVELGITAFVLKYRLANEPGSPYSIEGHARADMLRAVRVVRSRAERYGVDPNRVGVMGWSAGGELAAFASYGRATGSSRSADPIERHSARPNFQVIVYPGDRGLPTKLPSDAPAAFLLAARDDEGPARTVSQLARMYREAGLPVELHLLPEGGHGFNMGQRSESAAVRRWPRHLSQWLKASGWALAP